MLKLALFILLCLFWITFYQKRSIILSLLLWNQLLHSIRAFIILSRFSSNIGHTSRISIHLTKPHTRCPLPRRDTRTQTVSDPSLPRISILPLPHSLHYICFWLIWWYLCLLSQLQSLIGSKSAFGHFYLLNLLWVIWGVLICLWVLFDVVFYDWSFDLLLLWLVMEIDYLIL